MDAPKSSFRLVLEQSFLLMWWVPPTVSSMSQSRPPVTDTRPSLPAPGLPAYTQVYVCGGRKVGGRRREGLALPERASLQYEPVGAVLVLSSQQKLCHTLHRRGLGGRGCADAFSWQSYPWTSLCSPSNRERSLVVHTAKCDKGSTTEQPSLTH